MKMSSVKSRIPEQLKGRFVRVANHRGLSESALINWLVHDYVERYEEKHPHVNKNHMK